MKTTPYAYCANNPTNLIDPDGERLLASTSYYSGITENNLYEWVDLNGEWQFVDYYTREPYEIGTHVYIDELTFALRNLMKSPFMNDQINKVATMDLELKIDLSHVHNGNIYVSDNSSFIETQSYKCPLKNRNSPLK